MSTIVAPPADPSVPRGKAAGYAIAACGVLSIIAIALHPQATTHTMAGFAGEVSRLTPMLRLVHGAMIAFMLALIFGFAVFSLRRGLQREAVAAALVAYAAGAGLLILAALLDGFIVPALSVRYAGAPPDVLRIGGSIVSLCGTMLQVFSMCGVAAMSAAIVLWSCDLLRSAGAPRLVGSLGFAAALVPMAVLFLGGDRLVVMTLTIIVVAQGIWYIAVASLLVQERV